jgi:chorismate mutase
MMISRQIGEWKRDNNVIVFQVSRWEAILKRVLRLGEDMGLDREFVKQIYIGIHDESIRQQVDVMNLAKKEEAVNS